MQENKDTEDIRSINLSKKEFVVLWNIEKSWQSDPIKASDNTAESIKETILLFCRLNALELIKLEIRDNQVYGAVVTDKGRKIFDDKTYGQWIPE